MSTCSVCHKAGGNHSDDCYASETTKMMDEVDADEKEILDLQKESFSWSEFQYTAMKLLPDEIPIVTKYMKKFITSRPTARKPIPLEDRDGPQCRFTQAVSTIKR